MNFLYLFVGIPESFTGMRENSLQNNSGTSLRSSETSAQRITNPENAPVLHHPSPSGENGTTDNMGKFNLLPLTGSGDREEALVVRPTDEQSSSSSGDSGYTDSGCHTGQNTHRKTVNPDLALTLPTLANGQPTSEEETNLKNLS